MSSINRILSRSILVLWFVSGLAVAAAPPSTGKVTLTESSVTWKTAKHAIDEQGGLAGGSFDAKTIVDRTFKTWVLENAYLKVTLLPEFGGRILSIIYKPTGHEQLYRNPVGIPFGAKEGYFYYDWLIVYGGIFPTLPVAEHGKTWLKPWAFKIEKQTPDEVTVTMSIKDDFEYSSPPRKFRSAPTGIEATYYVTLKANRAAVDARMVLKNPSDDSIKYEYWTCTTLAPGSDPNDPKATAGAEIIAPIEAYSTPDWSANIAQNDKSAGMGKSRFEKLRYFKNWPSRGIAYAAPDMGGGNFWGVINHDNEEGIIRIADNTVTLGLKMWTWGFAESTKPKKELDEVLPYIELWGGVSDEFFHSAKFPAKSEVVIPEIYSPTVGLSGVTHANEKVLVNLQAQADKVDLQLFSVEPGAPLTVVLKRDKTVLFTGSVKADPKAGNRISAPIPPESSGERVSLVVSDAAGKPLLTAETPVREAKKEAAQ